MEKKLLLDRMNPAMYCTHSIDANIIQFNNITYKFFTYDAIDVKFRFRMHRGVSQYINYIPNLH